MNIESLESRIAPAATFTYIDLDGDVVTIATSQGTNADLSEANGVLTFSAPDPGDPDVPRQLYKIDLSGSTAIAQVFEGTDLSIKVTRKAAGGDGLVHVGFIDAAEVINGMPDEDIKLGSVTVGGDLGQIEAGDLTSGVKSLSVNSLGLFGLTTQGGTGDLISLIDGTLGALKVRGDVREALVSVTAFNDEDGTIGSVTIGGSLIGGEGTDTGVINATGDIGPVKIGGDVRAGDREGGGGVTNLTGSIFTAGKIASLTVGGSFLGGETVFDGFIGGNGSMGPVKIAGDVTGTLGSTGGMQSLTVGGSVRPHILVPINVAGAVRVAGDFDGALTLRTPASVSIGGSVLDGSVLSASFTGAIRTATIGGSVIGASITGVRTATIAGSVIGASIGAGGGDVGTVKIGGDWIATSISAGVNDTNNNGFGNDDQRIAGATLVSRIASIKIKGTVAGTGAAGDHFGFTAAQIGSFKALGFTGKLTPQTDAAIELSLITADVTIREV